MTGRQELAGVDGLVESLLALRSRRRLHDRGERGIGAARLHQDADHGKPPSGAALTKWTSMAVRWPFTACSLGA